jgi:hypothetical protein
MLLRSHAIASRSIPSVAVIGIRAMSCARIRVFLAGPTRIVVSTNNCCYIASLHDLLSSDANHHRRLFSGPGLTCFAGLGKSVKAGLVFAMTKKGSFVIMSSV